MNDTTFFASSARHLEKLLQKLENINHEYGLKINCSKYQSNDCRPHKQQLARNYLDRELFSGLSNHSFTWERCFRKLEPVTL